MRGSKVEKHCFFNNTDEFVEIEGCDEGVKFVLHIIGLVGNRQEKGRKSGHPYLCSSSEMLCVTADVYRYRLHFVLLEYNDICGYAFTFLLRVAFSSRAWLVAKEERGSEHSHCC